MVGRGQNAQFRWLRAVPHTAAISPPPLPSPRSAPCFLLVPPPDPISASPCPLGSQRHGSDSHLPEGKPWDFPAIFLHWPILEKRGNFSPLEGFLCPSAASFQAMLSHGCCRYVCIKAWLEDTRAAHHGSIANSYRLIQTQKITCGRAKASAAPCPTVLPAWGWVSDSQRPPCTQLHGKMCAARLVVTPGKQRGKGKVVQNMPTKTVKGALRFYFSVRETSCLKGKVFDLIRCKGK